MGRKVIIDCDPGIDDAVALAVALFDPRLEIVAITACSGCVDAHQSTQNLHGVIERIDPPRYPRLGAASDPEDAPVSDGQELHGPDGLGNLGLNPSGRQHLISSEKLIADRLKADPGEVSILCLGPLTGVANAFMRDPGLIDFVDRLFISGGTLNGIGDVTAAAEFNFHFDPKSAASIFRSPTTKTMVPLDVANQVSFGLELMEQLPSKFCGVGNLLHGILPYYFRMLRQHRGKETINLNSVVALMALIEPSLLTSEEATIDIEEHGDLTRGASIVDRREFARQRKNVELITSVDVEGAKEAIVRGLRFAGQCN